MIARERATSAVRAMHAGRKANNQKPRADITKWRYGPTVIAGVTVIDSIEKGRQTRAGATVFIEYCGVQSDAPLLLLR